MELAAVVLKSTVSVPVVVVEVKVMVGVEVKEHVGMSVTPVIAVVTAHVRPTVPVNPPAADTVINCVPGVPSAETLMMAVFEAGVRLMPAEPTVTVTETVVELPA
jgi:hypothetical protein